MSRPIPTTIKLVTTCNPLTGPPAVWWQCKIVASLNVSEMRFMTGQWKSKLAWRKKPLFLVNDLKLRILPLPVYKYEPLNQRHNYGVLRVGFKITMVAIDLTMWNVTYSQHDGLRGRSKLPVQTASCSQLCAVGGECMGKGHVMCMMRGMSEKKKAWTR